MKDTKAYVKWRRMKPKNSQCGQYDFKQKNLDPTIRLLQLGLERWFSSYEYCLLSRQTQEWFLALTLQLTPV